jgi:SAM-dependent methyltransferase
VIDLKQQIKRFVPRKLQPYLGGVRRRIVANPVRIERQFQRLLKNPKLSSDQLKTLEHVSKQIHHRDGMYAGSAEEYFAAGLSAIECVDAVLENARDTTISDVLDLPSGYGRELRFLKQKFPDAKITACDIQPGAVDFCAEAFGARPVYSKADVNELSFPRKFDLIWCGSLITHLDQKATLDLLELFARNLTPKGVMIVTTNGDFVWSQMREGATYDLPAVVIPELITNYVESGYAYRDYSRGLGYFEFHPEGRGYGVSLTSPNWFRALAQQAGPVEEIYFKPHAWADHQDVFGFRRV